MKCANKGCELEFKQSYSDATLIKICKECEFGHQQVSDYCINCNKHSMVDGKKYCSKACQREANK